MGKNNNKLPVSGEGEGEVINPEKNKETIRTGLLQITRTPYPGVPTLKEMQDFDPELYKKTIDTIDKENAHRHYMSKEALKLDKSDINKTFYSHISGNITYLIIIIALIGAGVYFFNQGDRELTKIIFLFTIGSISAVGLVGVIKGGGSASENLNKKMTRKK